MVIAADLASIRMGVTNRRRAFVRRRGLACNRAFLFFLLHFSSSM